MPAAPADRPLLLVVTGPPASGKTSAARALAEELGLAIVSKDALKETLYETIGSGEALEERLDAAALALLFAVAGMQLDAGVSVLAESNFDAGADTAPFRRLCADRDVRLVQVHIGGDPDALADGFAARARAGDRHPGHGDEPGDAGELRAMIAAGRWRPLDLPGELVRLEAGDEPARAIRLVRELLRR